MNWMRCGVPLVALLLCQAHASGAAEPLNIFVLAGQSNLVGSVNVQSPRFPGDQQTVFGDILLTQNVDDYVEAFGPLQPRRTNNGERRWAGLELTFGETLLEAGIEEIAIIKYGRTGSSLTETWEPDGALRTDFYSFVDSALAQLGAAGRPTRVAGFVWVQGSGDANLYGRAVGYDATLRDFVDEFEARYNPTTTVLNRYHLDSRRNYVDVLRTSQREFADADPNAYVVHGDDLSLRSDFIHYDDNAQLELGRRLAEGYLRTLEPEGDFSGDGVVNAADFTVLRDTIGSLAQLQADGDGDGVVDVDDLSSFARGFGAGVAPLGPPVAVPEPAAASLLCVILAPLLCPGRGKRRPVLSATPLVA